MDLYKGILCPVHRLPDDVLREILIRYCEDESAIPLSPGFVTLLEENDPVYILERVCSRWRRLSRSTVQLWTRLECHLIPGDTKDWTRFMEFTDRLLARSHNAPLSIHFLYEHLDFSSAANTARTFNPRIFDKLMRSTDRWKELIANARCIALLQGIGIIPDALPNVTLVDLGCSFDRSLTWLVDSNMYPQPLGLPSASTLYLTNTVQPGDPPSENYDFLHAPNITYVNIEEFPDTRLLLPSLTAYQLDTLTLTLHDNGFTSSAGFALALVDLVFPRLTTLNIQTRDGQWGRAIPWALRGLTCPCLSALAICATPGERDTSAIITTLADFLSRSACQLDELIISGLPPLDVSGALDLKALQSISALTIRMHSVLMEAVDTVIIKLASMSSSYQLSTLWLLIDFHREGPPDQLTQPFSLSRLADLRNANIWKSGTQNAAEIRVEVSDIEPDIKEKLLRFCDSTRRSPVRVSFASDHAYWKQHLIHKLEHDIRDDR
ncbi:hypothetical protein BKA70DRAFT_293101 [Coprinopsis sp. MPI-PUGE-AT-0042]|nr:hypothetical protein BKA70DRAFT_293101 [Coprinopsis sp. MPI-PUGE-AT-0042]